MTGADPLTTAVHANITAELAHAKTCDSEKTPTTIARMAWPDITANAAGTRIRRMLAGEHLRLVHLPALARALGIDCDDLTSTETEAARAALGADQ